MRRFANNWNRRRPEAFTGSNADRALRGLVLRSNTGSPGRWPDALQVATDRWSVDLEEGTGAPHRSLLHLMFPRVPTNGRYPPREMAATSPQPRGHHPATCHGPNTPTRPGLAVVPRTLPPRARPRPPSGTTPCALVLRSGTSSSCSRCTPAWSAPGSAGLCPAALRSGTAKPRRAWLYLVFWHRADTHGVSLRVFRHCLDTHGVSLRGFGGAWIGWACADAA